MLSQLCVGPFKFLHPRNENDINFRTKHRIQSERGTVNDLISGAFRDRWQYQTRISRVVETLKSEPMQSYLNKSFCFQGSPLEDFSVMDSGS